MRTMAAIIRYELKCMRAGKPKTFLNRGSRSHQQRLRRAADRRTLRHLDKKASAAAEGDAVVANPFLPGGLCSTPVPACSRAVENLHSPQHDDDGCHQRSRRQDFQGSYSHTLLSASQPRLTV